METPGQKKSPQTGFENITLVNLAFEIGWLIAVPAVVFAFGGAWLDQKIGTSPLFLLTGLVVAVAASSLGVYRIVKKILPPEKH